MKKTLEQVLAEVPIEAAVLRKHGELQLAKAIERLAADVATAAENYLDFLTEDEAMLRSGRTRSFLRNRFAGWEAEGMARKDGRRRKYRRCIIPRRPDLGAAREAGRRAAKVARAERAL